MRAGSHVPWWQLLEWRGGHAGGEKGSGQHSGDVRGTESAAIAIGSTVRATERAISQPVEVRNSTEGLEQWWDLPVSCAPFLMTPGPGIDVGQQCWPDLVSCKEASAACHQSDTLINPSWGNQWGKTAQWWKAYWNFSRLGRQQPIWSILGATWKMSNVGHGWQAYSIRVAVWLNSAGEALTCRMTTAQ